MLFLNEDVNITFGRGDIELAHANCVTFLQRPPEDYARWTDIIFKVEIPKNILDRLYEGLTRKVSLERSHQLARAIYALCEDAAKDPSIARKEVYEGGVILPDVDLVIEFTESAGANTLTSAV